MWRGNWGIDYVTWSDGRYCIDHYYVLFWGFGGKEKRIVSDLYIEIIMDNYITFRIGDTRITCNKKEFLETLRVNFKPAEIYGEEVIVHEGLKAYKSVMQAQVSFDTELKITRLQTNIHKDIDWMGT